MSRVTVSEDSRGFVREGAPWFYLADTVWTGVTGPTDDEWRRYLDQRCEQGFTAVQINHLPQWDRSVAPLSEQPFAVRQDDSYDFSAPNAAYFRLAASRYAEVSRRGMVPVVVLLWCNYVPDTWCAMKRPGRQIPEDALEGYLRLAVESAAPHDPLYFVSGDTDFPSPRANEYYATGLRIVKELDPGALTSLHVRGAFSELPESIVAMPELDFYTFQSGHSAQNWYRAAELAASFRRKRPARPVVNAEPCYEGHCLGHAEGRFGATEVRQAAWQGIVAGANAGVTYGAHGLWGWHREGLPFPSTAFSGVPFPWEHALGFPGADDYGLILDLAHRYHLFDLEPCSFPGLPKQAQAARCAGGSRVIVYLPYAFDLPLDKELEGLKWHRVDLGTRSVRRGRVITIDGKPHLAKGAVNGDSLVVGEGRGT